MNITAQEGKKDIVFTEWLHCGKELLNWKQAHTETHPPCCIVCQTTSPWGDTGPHVLVTTASGWTSQGWGGTELRWSPTHRHNHAQADTQRQTHTCTYRRIKSTFQQVRRVNVVFWVSKLLVYARKILAVNQRHKIWTEDTFITENAKPQLDLNFRCTITSSSQRLYQL